MKTGILQFRPEFGRVEDNLDKAGEYIDECDADLMVLPELFSTGYQFVSRREADELAEPVPGGPASRFLLDTARKKNMIIAAGIAEKADEGLYNSALLAGPEGVIGKYRKIHLFYEENLYFKPGGGGFEVYDTGGIRIGMMICYDWIFPESARTLALKGADIICHPSNLVLPHCPRSMYARSVENGIFTATANRTGYEERGGKERLSFIGSSLLFSPAGENLISFGKDEEGVKTADIIPEQARSKKISKFNDLFADRRPGKYT